MRTPALLMLAGLAALTFAAVPASALCAVEEDGGCSGIAAPAVAFDVRSDCADSAGGLCLADDGNASNILAGNDLHLNVTNHHGQAIDFEVFLIARVDDACDDTSGPECTHGDRRAPERIALLQDIAAGETRYAKIAIDGNASELRFQALSADAKHAELDVQALHIMYMTGMPEDGGEVVDPAADEDGRAVDTEADGKDAPYLGIVALVAVLAGIAGFRRFD